MRLCVALLLLTSFAAAEDFFWDRVGIVAHYEKEVARGRELVLKGVTKGAFRGAELIIIAPNGRTFLNKKNDVVDVNFTFTVEFEDGPGRYRLEIIAHKPNDTRSLGRFSIFYAAPATEEKEPPPPTGAPTPIELHPRLVEKRWLALLNEFRASLRLKPVKWNEAASARCREHARRMVSARRQIQTFAPYGGIADMLRKSGAGKGNDSGPTAGWPRISSRRPFSRPHLQPRGKRVYNYLVPFVIGDDPKAWTQKPSLERLFEKVYVREAAWRICAADPNCLEVGVGFARPQPKVTTGKRKTRKALRKDALYYAMVFLQLNDKQTVAAQDAYYAGFLRRAATRKTPALLRRLGVWGRAKGIRTLSKALQHHDDEVASAAFDGLLLLAEQKALDGLQKSAVKADLALEQGDYGATARAWRPYLHVRYDSRISRHARDRIAAAHEQAEKELGAAVELEPELRARRLQSLLRRCRDLPIEPKVKAALKAARSAR